MAASAQDESGTFAEINVTPLVDVTLVLLIVFMVAAPMMVNTPSIRLELPKAASGEESNKTNIALTLQRDPGGGTLLYLNGARSEEAAVRSAIPRLLERDREVQGIISADKPIAYGEVMHIVDLVKTLGIHKFALDIDPDL